MTKASNEPFRVSIYYDTEKEGKEIYKVLERVNPGRTHLYNGIIDGWATHATLEKLKKRGLSIVVTGSRVPEQPVAAEVKPASEDKFAFAVPPEIISVEGSALFDSLGGVVGKSRGSMEGAGGGAIIGGVGSVGEPPKIAPYAPYPPYTPLYPSKRDNPEMKEQLQKLQRELPSGKGTSDELYEVMLKDKKRSEWEEKLKLYGEIKSFRPPNVYYMTLPGDGRNNVLALPFVRRARRYSIENKVTPELLEALKEAEVPVVEQESEGFSLASDSDVPVVPTETFEVVSHTPKDLAKVKKAIKAREGTKIIGHSDVALRFTMPVDLAFIATLANMMGVASVSRYKPSSLFSDRVRSLIGLAAIDAGAHKWTGKKEVIGILDSGIDDTHPDLADRVKVSLAIEGASAKDMVGHGTHVAGIIAGTGAASKSEADAVGSIRGVAPDARLVVVGITDAEGIPQLAPFVDLGKLLSLATKKGAKIINLSWGEPIGGSYVHGSASVDKFVYKHPDVLVVVAAGNSGKEDAQGNLTFNEVCAPATAKNVITVGASATDRAEEQFKKTWAQWRPSRFSRPKAIDRLVSGDPDLPAANSSRGPTDFDSVKPDLLAPGTFILSARLPTTSKALRDSFYWAEYEQFNNRYAFLGGSSMATPVVAGAAAVLRQYLREEKKVAKPSAALLKALLIASARKVPSVNPPEIDAEIGYPDFDQGFGRLDLSSLLPHAGAAPGRDVLFVDIPNNSPAALESRAAPTSIHRATQLYKFKVPKDSVEPLRVVLVWTDFPGNSIQNNLQVEVTTPGRILVGNEEHKHYKGAPTDDKNSQGVPYDKRNNVEYIKLNQPAEGEYLVRVIAQNTLHPPQGYALCICGQVASTLDPVS